MPFWTEKVSFRWKKVSFRSLIRGCAEIVHTSLREYYSGRVGVLFDFASHRVAKVTTKNGLLTSTTPQIKYNLGRPQMEYRQRTIIWQ
jgi:hypothetical protein